MVYKLSAQLTGHDTDVRAACFPDPSAVITASRDTTVRVWRQTSGKPPVYEATITTKGQDFINSLAYIPPSAEYSDGLIVSGGKDTIIEVKKPNSVPDDNAERLLIGHAHNICALAVSNDGTYLVSGSWDSSAIVWRVGKWEPEIRLEGHSGSVWGVVALDAHTVITGCADEKLRIFDLRKASGGVVEATSTIHTGNVVRAVCALPKGHPSRADIASAHNDGIIRLWKLSGESLGELHGHESFVYSLATLPSGEILSAGEDRTARVWKGTECIQTITHPAISVWTVAACQATGDIVTGASDGVARIFTRSEDRMAESESIAQFDDAVKGSSIPQQQVGGINKEQLPGPEFLQNKSGTKEGQVQMIKEDNGAVTAHQWSMSQQQWVNVGTVVDAVGSSGKKVDYLGKSYDYVFDVDIEDGAPALKLPYNLSQNPYEAATKFLGDNELPLSYLDNVANFIVENTKGATLGAAAPTNTTDFGVGKYQPESDTQAAKPKKLLPQREYLTLGTAKAEPVLKKILSINATMISSGRKEFALNPSEETTLKTLGDSLSKFVPSIPVSVPPMAANKARPLNIPDGALRLISKLVIEWPYTDRLPGLDLLRCMAADAYVATYQFAPKASAITTALKAAFDHPAEVQLNENMVMMAFRVVANSFTTEKGREDAEMTAWHVVPYMERMVGIGANSTISKNRNLLLALSTAAINYAISAHSSQKPSGDTIYDLGLITRICRVGEKLINDPASADQEVMYRALVLLGTLASLKGSVGKEIKGLGLAAKVNAVADSGGAEARVKEVARECLTLLK